MDGALIFNIEWTDIDWNLIKSFVTVAETGSLSAAARKLSASQPTLGRHIGELETGARRHAVPARRRGYELTEAGSTLFERGKAVSEQASGLLTACAGFGRGDRRHGADCRKRGGGGLCAARDDGAARYRGARASKSRSSPPTRSRTCCGAMPTSPSAWSSRRRTNWWRARSADIPLCACAATILSRPARPPAGRTELARHDADRLRPQRRHHPRPCPVRASLLPASSFRFRTDNQIVLWEAVRAGNGIGFGQEPLADRDPLVEKLLPDLPLPSLPVWLAMHRDVRTSVRIRRVADFLHDALRSYARSD